MPVDMKNRRSLQIIFAVILAATLITVVTRPWDRFERGIRGVVLRNTEEVDRIVLVDPYNSTELIRKEDRWYLFGTATVNPVPVENLLIAASRLEVSSITEDEAFADSVDLDGDATEVTFYRGEKVLLSYSLKVQSGRCLVHPSGSGRSYYVTLPGYPGLDLDRLFSAAPDYYLEHLLIDLRPSEISEIEIELASGEAFRFRQDLNGDIQCEPANENTILPPGELNELRTRLLFSYFTSIRYEQPAGISADSLLNTAARQWEMGTISVDSFSGEHHTLRVFSYHRDGAGEPDLFKAVVLYNNEPEAVFINYTYLDVLMRGLSHYFGEK